jgi:hypothetical protein
LRLSATTLDFVSGFAAIATVSYHELIKGTRRSFQPHNPANHQANS